MYSKNFLLFYYPNHVLLMSIMHSAIAIILVDVIADVAQHMTCQ